VNYEQLCKNTFELDPQIRFTGVLNHMGELIVGGIRDDITSLLSPDEVKMSFHYTLQNWENLQNLAYKIGNERFSIMEYDKVTLISIPFNEKELFLLRVESSADYFKIIDKVKVLLQNQ